MADQIDNISFALISLKEVIENYLDAQGWKNKYSIYCYGDPALEGKELSINPGRSQNKIGLPLIIIRSGFTRNKVEQLGDEFGRDMVSLSLHILATDNNQLLTLGHLLRRKLDKLTFSILDYRTSRRVVLDTGETYRAEFIEISNPDSDKIQDRNSALLKATLELNSESFL